MEILDTSDTAGSTGSQMSYVDTISAAELTREIIRLLHLRKGKRFEIVQTREGSLILRKPQP